MRLSRSAFTLIELLVVVAIIAVLVAILLPSLANARAQSKRVQCGTTLRQWGQVLQMYTQEFDGWVMGAYKDGTWMPWYQQNASGVRRAYDAIWSQDNGTAAFRLATVVKMRRCPADPVATLGYVMPRYRDSVNGSANNMMWRMTGFNHPGTTVFLIDGDRGARYGATYWGCFFDISAFYSQATATYSENNMTMDNLLEQRHKGIGNAVFLDGHVEQVGWKDYVKNIPSSAAAPMTGDDATKVWSTQGVD